MLQTACFMLRFDEEFIDKIVLIIQDLITVLFGLISANEVYPLTEIDEAVQKDLIQLMQYDYRVL